MMPKLIIRVEKQTELIEETFNDMEFNGKLGKTKVKVFKVIFKSKLNGLYIMMKRRVRKWIVNGDDNYFEAIEDGDMEHILGEKYKFEKFMLGTEKQLKEEKEYQKFKNDRAILQVLRYFKAKGTAAKDKAIGKALGEMSVLNFFNRFCISITWRIIEE